MTGRQKESITIFIMKTQPTLKTSSKLGYMFKVGITNLELHLNLLIALLLSLVYKTCMNIDTSSLRTLVLTMTDHSFTSICSYSYIHVHVCMYMYMYV